MAFTRATIKKPDILILENALASYDMKTQVAVYKRLRELLPDTTVVYLNDQFENPGAFDMYVEIRQGRVISDGGPVAVEEDSAASADLTRKLRALEQTPLFSGLDRRQLRLLAFGARWFEAAPGQVVFLKDDQPTDGAYVVLEGEAGLYLPQEQGPDQLITKVGPGALVGELGLIRKEPRALSMVAETQLSCLRIGEEEFLAVVEKRRGDRIQAVAGYRRLCVQLAISSPCCRTNHKAGGSLFRWHRRAMNNRSFCLPDASRPTLPLAGAPASG